jgi:hypothetical protein
MAYTIYNTDGTVLSTIAVGEVDNFSTSLDLIGKNVNNYGEYYNNNLVKLLTNFASVESEEPSQPQTGQLWYNKTEKQLKIFDNGFRSVGGASVSGTPPVSATTGTTGTIWFNTIDGQLEIWDGRQFNLIGPATSKLLGKFGILPAASPIRDNETKLAQKASLIHSYGSYVGLITTASFIMETSSATLYLNRGEPQYIKNGITVFNDLEVKGNLYIDGWDVKNHPNIDLSAFYNITPFGTFTATMTTSSFSLTNTNLLAYNAANYAISQDLARMFDITRYAVGSRVSVVCTYNTSTSVRRFELMRTFLQQNYGWWEPLNDYRYTFTATSTSTVGHVNWLWTNTTFTNIVHPAWNEIIRTDSTASTSNTFIDPIPVDTPFYIKITGGVPDSKFTLAALAPLDTTVLNGTLDTNGAFTTASIVTSSIQPVTTSVVYTYNATFAATNHVRQMQFTIVRP